MSFLTHCCSRCCCCLVWMDSSMYESLKSTGFQCQSVSVCRRYCLLWVCTAVTLEITTIFSYCCYCFCQLSSECLSCLTACSLLPCSAVILVNQLKCQPTGAHCRPNCYRFDRTDSPALPINRSNEEESGDKASRSALVCVCVTQIASVWWSIIFSSANLCCHFSFAAPVCALVLLVSLPMNGAPSCRSTLPLRSH